MSDSTTQKRERVKVKALFPVESERAIFAVVEDSDWGYHNRGPVEVCVDSVKFPMRYRGHTGHAQPVLIISPMSEVSEPLSQIVAKLGGTEPSSTYIERVLPCMSGS